MTLGPNWKKIKINHGNCYYQIYCKVNYVELTFSRINIVFEIIFFNRIGVILVFIMFKKLDKFIYNPSYHWSYHHQYLLFVSSSSINTVHLFHILCQHKYNILINNNKIHIYISSFLLFLQQCKHKFLFHLSTYILNPNKLIIITNNYIFS